MAKVGIVEARKHLSEWVERAARGEEIVITRRGKAVARLMPPEVTAAQVQAQALAERIRCSRTGHALGEGMTLRELIEEGRR